MAYPAETVRWSDVSPSTTRDEPSSGEKDTGWIADEVPTHGIMNWLIGVSGDWLTWLQTCMASGFDSDIAPRTNGVEKLGSTSLRWASIHGVSIYGTDYRLDANYSSVVRVPIAAFNVANPASTPGWNFIPGGDASADATLDDHLVCLVNSAVLTAEVSVPQGSKIVAVVFDADPYGAGAPLMKFSAFKVNYAGLTSANILAANYIESSGSARDQFVLTADQNNTGFSNKYDPGQPLNTLRLRVEAASDGSGGDAFYGAMVILAHQSVGAYNDAPNAT